MEEWRTTFGGSEDDYAMSVQETSDGGYIITGETYSFGAGGYEVYLVKTDSQGPSLVRGKGIWIWGLSEIEGGNVSAIIERCKNVGIEWVAVKCGDGVNFWDEQCTPSLITQFQDAGIRFLGWQYVYGDDPVGEAGVANEILGAGVDGFIVDAEGEYEGKPDKSIIYLENIRG